MICCGDDGNVTVDMRQAKVRYTYNDYLLLPEDKRHEILDGEIHVVPAPSIKHQRILVDLFDALLHHVRRRQLGEVLPAPVDVLLSSEDVVQPDIVFVLKERATLIGDANIKGAPDLVVEILSPTNRDKDTRLKRKTYARFGVQEYWIVDPDKQTVEILVWSKTGYVAAGTFSKSETLTSPLLPDLKLPLSNVFA